MSSTRSLSLGPVSHFLIHISFSILSLSISKNVHNPRKTDYLSYCYYPTKPTAIQVRKTTRVTRATKNTENANARPSRVSTRSKTLAAELLAPVTTRATAPTAASKAKALAPEAETSAGKRKREVLVEVTGLVTNNKAKGKGSSTTVKGKESATAKGKEKETEVAKKPAVSKVVRARPAAAASGIAKHVRGASVSTTASSKTTGTEESSGTERVVLKRAATKNVPSTSSFVAKAETQTRTTTTAAKGKTLLQHEVDDVEEGRRVFKRRHVDIPEEPVQQDTSQIEADRIAAELIEADAKAVPEFKEEPVELWDDLDAGDWDDPFMVSEYVVEVCKYWKVLEVCFGLMIVGFESSLISSISSRRSLKAIT